MLGDTGYLNYKSDHMEYGTNKFTSDGSERDTSWIRPINTLSVTGYSKLYVEYEIGWYFDIYFGAPYRRPAYGSDFPDRLSSLREGMGYYTKYTDIQDVGNVMIGIWRK